MTDTANPTLIQTPFGFNATAAEVIDGIDLSGKRAIVTGGSSGIGIETARALVGAGAEVTLAVRDTDAGERTATDITATTGSVPIVVGRLDLADQASVATFVTNWSGPLDLLINNAGVMVPDLQRTQEGWEMQFATNHLGHFALALGLHDALADAGDARIVSLSSVGHRRSPVVFHDINFTSRPYDPGLAYGQSKTANVLFAVEATRRWSRDGICANAVHPGTIASTSLNGHMGPDVLAHLRASAPYADAFDASKVKYKTAQQGAATSVFVATSPQLDGIGGRYFEDCSQARVLDPDAPNTTSSGVAAYALDAVNANRLWEASLGLLGFEPRRGFGEQPVPTTSP
ncbi:MAG: short-chain dehydrogenase/reductase [Solirubrobacterales bacterium]|jgi:NAD(P)-dependent dehydrogenase (short-subunit alcohol dehydrogenase family)|nr:short-chain dehydrogenase/reductase [Solirubrobacterales bacterium]